MQNHLMNYIAIAISALGLLLGPLGYAQDLPQLDLPRTKLSAGMHLIDAQLAATPEQRSTGLMFRRDMPASEGMLFVFEQASQQCFWMKNTLFLFIFYQIITS